MSYRITVNHAHVFPPSINPDGTIDRLYKLMDACGIEEAVCFARLPIKSPARESITKMNGSPAN